MNIKLHNHLCQQFIDFTQYNLESSNRKAEKYQIQEQTFFDRNPVFQQLKQRQMMEFQIISVSKTFFYSITKISYKNYKDFV
ncbi:unnamed protein product [Paramecium primaurelia]|uniref:Uncharacterized protein n=1 Tax=Paramecium primaurelia TaxID=5886 RepID=A0A8S1PG93_PARPR|nr:unnamed protein product [Paramecium primaurelia]